MVVIEKYVAEIKMSIVSNDRQPYKVLPIYGDQSTDIHISLGPWVKPFPTRTLHAFL